MSAHTMANMAVEVVILPDGRMTRRNASRYVGCADKTLAQYASKGTGPKFVKRGRVWYYKEDLDAWLRGGSATSTAAARLAACVTVGHDSIECRTDRSDDDARLFAAAPELFGIVETIAKLLDQGAPSALILDENSLTRDAIRDVIAKITRSQA